MKRKQLSPVVLGLAWMVSLGAVFILGILSAFTFHLAPGSGSGSQGDLTLDQRDMILVMERFTGEEVDVAAILSINGEDPVPEQLDQTLRAILRVTDPDYRQMYTTRLIGGLPARRIMAAIRLLQGIPQSPARNQVLRVFVESWGYSDGRSAIGFASSLESQRERLLATGAVLTGWSRARPTDAWNWVIEREGKTRRAERWLEIILANLGRTDRETALALLEKSPEGDFQTRMSLVVLEQILRTESPREALRWLGELPAGSTGAAASFVAESWALTEPEAAADWLYRSYPGELEGMGNVIREWTYSFPNAAAEWVWEQYTGSLRRDIMDILADEWVANDGPVPLAEWLNTHGPDSSLDGAIATLVLATASLDPATALIWAQSIIDPDSRSMLEIFVGRQWIRLDPIGAGESLPLALESESARAALLEPEEVYEPAFEEIDDTFIDETTVPFDEENEPLPLQ